MKRAPFRGTLYGEQLNTDSQCEKKQKIPVYWFTEYLETIRLDSWTLGKGRRGRWTAALTDEGSCPEVSFETTDLTWILWVILRRNESQNLLQWRICSAKKREAEGESSQVFNFPLSLLPLRAFEQTGFWKSNSCLNRLLPRALPCLRSFKDSLGLRANFVVKRWIESKVKMEYGRNGHRHSVHIISRNSDDLKIFSL